MFALKTIVLAFAALAVAVPHKPVGAKNSNTEVDVKTFEQAHDECSHMQDGNTQISCCNTESEDEGDDIGGLIGSLDGLNLLGGNCQPITIPVLGVAVPITNTCNQQVACCSGDQNVSNASFPIFTLGH